MKRITLTKEDWKMLHWVSRALNRPASGPYPYSALKYLYLLIMRLSDHKSGLKWLILIYLGLFVGCSMTVAPKPVNATVIAFDKNTQNAGLIDCDKTGCLVTPGWMSKYKAMETEFKQPNAADVNIKSEGHNYRVSFEVQNHYAEMREGERGP